MENLLKKLKADKVFYEKVLKEAVLNNETLEIIDAIKSMLVEIDEMISGEEMNEELKFIPRNLNLTR